MRALPLSARITLVAGAAALLFFLLLALFNAPATRGLEGRDDYQLRFAVLWFIAHVVGAPTGIKAGTQTKNGWLVLLSIAHVGLLFVSGGIAVLYVLLSGSHFH